MVYKISRDLKAFSAAHRLNKDYPGKCQTLHGHTYKGSVTIAADSLDAYDFVMDFDDLKRLFDDWVQANWDHVTLVSEMDKPLIQFLEQEQQAFFVLPNQRNTTCEALAEFLFTRFSQLLYNDTKENMHNIRLLEVRVSESDFSHAAFTES